MTKIIDRAGLWLARTCLTLSALCLFSIMILTVVEVIGRYLFNAPIFGRQDIAQILLALSIFLAFPVVTLRGEQIDVDLLDGLFSERAAIWRDRLIAVLVAVSLLTMGYWLFARAEKVMSRGITTELLFLPKFPLIYFIAIVVTATGLLLAVQCVTSMVKGKRA